MKVRMLVSIAGHAEPKYGLPEFAFKPGEVVELNDTLAEAWVTAEIAQLVAITASENYPKLLKLKKDSK